MRKLIFATHNSNKLREVKNLLPRAIKILSFSDIRFEEPILETGQTLEENALLKARHVYGFSKEDTFADDTGLEVEALDNKPGVYSARFAGDDKNHNANIEKVLKLLKGKNNRKAKFIAVIALILKGEEYIFKGVLAGTITKKIIGEGGFGYDPIFIPNGCTKTFAQMSLEEKNKISHRASAIKKLMDCLKNLE